MSAWPTKSLGELVDIVVGKTPSRSRTDYWGGTHAWASIADLKSRAISNTKEGITDLAVAEAKPKLISPGTVLFSFKLSVGKVSITQVPLYTNEAIAALYIRRADELDTRYLARALDNLNFSGDGNRAVMGSTLNRPMLEAIRIQLPPLPEQRRIASILDQTETARARRRRSIEELNAYLNSVFVELFEGRARESKLKDVAEIRTGSTPDRSREDFYGGNIPWVKTGEVNGRSIFETEEHVTDAGVTSARLRTYPIGSIVIAMYGQGKTRGQSAVLAVPATVNQACAVILPDPSFSTEFMAHQLRMSYERLRAKAQGGNQANLNLQLVGDLDVLLPNLKDQKLFETTAQRVTSLQEEHRAHLALLDELFASLQHRAFTGQL